MTKKQLADREKLFDIWKKEDILIIYNILVDEHEQKSDTCINQISMVIKKGLFEKEREFKFSFSDYNYLPKILDKLEEKCRNSQILSMQVFYPCGDNLKCGCPKRIRTDLHEHCPGYVIITRTDTKL